MAAAPSSRRSDGSAPLTRAGIAYRAEVATWVDSRPDDFDCLELRAEVFPKGTEPFVRLLARRYPVILGTSRLSLGTPGPLDVDILASFADLVAATDPLWVTECLAFQRTNEIDLACPNPILLDADALAVVGDHCREVMDRCGKRLLVENIVAHVRPAAPLREPEFLIRLCETTGCGILLDVTAVVVNARNHGFDARAWIASIDPALIVQLHLGGAALEDGTWVDRHGEPIEDEVWELAGEVIASGTVSAAILQHDGGVSHPSVLTAELDRLRHLT